MPSLNSHSRQYHISAKDGAFLILTGFTGAPYAKRHWELSKRADATHRLGHRVIAVAECVPVLGGVIAAIERAVHAIKHREKEQNTGQATTGQKPETPSIKRLSVPSLTIPLIPTIPSPTVPVEEKIDIKSASLPTISEVVLETRSAIIKKVEDFLDSHPNHPPLLFLLGYTGAGMSTTFSFLRGDKFINTDGSFKSEKESEGLISDELSDSCTLLPNLFYSEKLILIDYPGFGHTNGPLVNLGIELALKDLLKRHPSKILVNESITDTESAFRYVDKMSHQLSRILDDKTNCLVGLTKYSNYYHYWEIERLHKKLLDKSPDEKAVLSRIKSLKKSLSLVSGQERVANEKMIKAFEEELEALEKEREAPEGYAWKIREEIKQRQEAIKKTENLILEHLGISSLVRLDDLSNSEAAQDILNRISSDDVKPVHANLQSKSLSETESRIYDRIQEELFPILHAMPFHDHYGYGEEGIKAMMANGLIASIVAQDSPIGRFLSLPEMQSFSKDCDRKFIQKAFRRELETATYILSFGQLDFSPLQQNLLKLAELILKIKGIPTNQDPETVKAEWKKIQNYRPDHKPIPPRWAAEILLIPPGGPEGLLKLNKYNNEPSPELLDLCTQELDYMYRLINFLFNLKTMTEQEPLS